MIRDDQKRTIGKIVSVSADRFTVELHSGTDNFMIVGFDDVHYVARLGSFLMVPVQTAYVVVEIVGLRERDISTGRRVDAELDKTASAKYLDVVPVGMLPQDGDAKFRFGVSVYPSLYADVLYPLDEELDRVFQTDVPVEPVPTVNNIPPLPPSASRIRALTIGRSVVTEGYEVKVRMDEFFGGHTAVLGNTGSGKSCTVASVLQSLFEKSDEHLARGATFIVFDVNGEYTRSLSPLVNDRGIGLERLIVDGSAAKGSFRLPHWFLEQSEWELLLQASERTQVPLLRTALGLTGLLRNDPRESEVLRIKEHFIASCVIECFRGADGDSPVSKFQRVVSLLSKYSTNDLNTSLLSKYHANDKYGNFPSGYFEQFLAKIREKLCKEIELPSYDQTPFTFSDLEECLDFAILYEEAHGNRQIRDYCSQMMTRFKSLKERREYAFLRYDLRSGESGPSAQEFLTQILGLELVDSDFVKRNQIVIVDMNAVEDEVIELVASVLARMTFQLLRQAEPRNSFPVHLVLEEAHRYIAETPSRYAIDASRIYERIAKEGRKYGLFLVAASQRPGELSKTVLSQCSNFIIHRIQNPDDLSQIRQMTPFISEAVLKRLPSLPKQHALVFGTSVNLPTTFRVRDANPLPKSLDARIRDHWFHEEGRGVLLRIGGGTDNGKVSSDSTQ